MAYWLYICIKSNTKNAGGVHVKTSVTGVPIGNNNSAVDKMWKTFSALGNIAIAFAFSIVLIEIQASLSRVLRREYGISIVISTSVPTL